MYQRTGRYGPYWLCTVEGCGGTHGAHPDGTPLGTPADVATREARKVAHEAFDWIWKDGHIPRTAAYHMLADRMGLPDGACHIGSFDAAQCQKVVEVMKRFEMLRGAGKPLERRRRTGGPPPAPQAFRGRKGQRGWR